MKLSDDALDLELKLIADVYEADGRGLMSMPVEEAKLIIQELKLARKMVDLQDKLLVAYRLGGKKGVGKIIDALQETRKAYDDFGKEANHEHNR